MAEDDVFPRIPPALLTLAEELGNVIAGVCADACFSEVFRLSPKRSEERAARVALFAY
jgi:hypothetical protein